jgi:ribonuclease HI
MPSSPGCTLITDASFFCSGVAGWAAWAKADEMERCTWEGQIAQTWVRTSSEAELAAIALGMRAVADYAPRHRLLIQSDSLRALSVLRQELGLVQSRHPDGMDVPPSLRGVPGSKREGGVTDSEARLIEQVAALRRGFGQLMVRHVKGHVPRKHGLGRHRVNADCDERAKAQMVALRDRFVAAQEMRAACAS